MTLFKIRTQEPDTNIVYIKRRNVMLQLLRKNERERLAGVFALLPEASLTYLRLLVHFEL